VAVWPRQPQPQSRQVRPPPALKASSEQPQPLQSVHQGPHCCQAHLSPAQPAKLTSGPSLQFTLGFESSPGAVSVSGLLKGHGGASSSTLDQRRSLAVKTFLLALSCSACFSLAAPPGLFAPKHSSKPLSSAAAFNFVHQGKPTTRSTARQRPTNPPSEALSPVTMVPSKQTPALAVLTLGTRPAVHSKHPTSGPQQKLSANLPQLPVLPAFVPLSPSQETLLHVWPSYLHHGAACWCW